MQITSASLNTDQQPTDRVAAPAPRIEATPENNTAAGEVSSKVQPVPIQSSTPQPSVSSATSAPDVTFKRDAAGQIYYVFTDPQTGDELREIPPKEIRSVGEGIADYLKQEQEKSTPHVRLKA